MTVAVFFNSLDHDDLPDLLTAQPKSVDVVVIPGAWRRPDGSLSLAFQRRIDHGVRVALLFSAKYIILTGGLNDSALASEYLHSHRDSASLFSDSFISGLPTDVQSRALDIQSKLRYQQLSGDTLGEVIRRANYQGNHGQMPQIITENVSTTTFENAIETRKVLDQLPGRGNVPLTVAVVTSMFHVHRCRILFGKEVRGCKAPGCTTIVIGTSESMMEVTWPSEWFSSVDVPPPSLAHLRFVPHGVKVLLNSLYCTYANWRAHIRCSMLSIEAVSKVRELFAYFKAFGVGQLTPFDFTFTSLW